MDKTEDDELDGDEPKLPPGQWWPPARFTPHEVIEPWHGKVTGGGN